MEKDSSLKASAHGQRLFNCKSGPYVLYNRQGLWLWKMNGQGHGNTLDDCYISTLVKAFHNTMMKESWDDRLALVVSGPKAEKALTAFCSIQGSVQMR